MAYKFCINVPYLPNYIETRDLEAIKKAIQQQSPDVLFRFFRLDQPPPHWLKKPTTLPTLTWLLHRFPKNLLGSFSGDVRKNVTEHKATQLKRLEQIGVNVPAWTRLTKNLQLPQDQFGDHVMIKSTEANASKGRGITLVARKQLLAEAEVLALEYEQPGRSAPLVQRFIKTGDAPIHHRVITFMGEPILTHQSNALEQTPIAAPTAVLALTDKAVSNSGRRRRTFDVDQEIVKYAAKASTAFPETALIAFDVIREADTGKLYVLEMNAGDVWAFSSQFNTNLREEMGRENMLAQFNAIEVVASKMIAEVKERQSQIT